MEKGSFEREEMKVCVNPYLPHCIDLSNNFFITLEKQPLALKLKNPQSF